MGRVLVAAALALSLGAPAPALADGDPASDVLPVEDVFTGYPPPPTANDLHASVARAYASGQRVKVAVIASRRDLGSIPSLWRKPAAYAQFLGREIGGFYSGPLLIVMPSGFGVYDAHHTTAAERASLARRRVDGGSAASLVASAAHAVDALVAAGALRSPDRQPPLVYGSAVTVHPGKPAQLAYRVLENSERSAETVTVYAGAKKLTVLHSPRQPSTYTAAHRVTWDVPAAASHKGLRYCVVAVDPSGNSSKPVCSSLNVR